MPRCEDATNGFKINDAKVVTPDLEATNGVVQATRTGADAAGRCDSNSQRSGHLKPQSECSKLPRAVRQAVARFFASHTG